MKYICFGYFDKGKFEGVAEGEQHAMFDTCFEYDDHLRANGHFATGEAPQPPETAGPCIGRTAKWPLPTVLMPRINPFPSPHCARFETTVTM